MKTAGQIAYEMDLRARPLYHDGAARKPWSALGEIERDTWEKNPTPRSFGRAAQTDLTEIGEQFVIPGCEKRGDRKGSPPAQPTLWDKT